MHCPSGMYGTAALQPRRCVMEAHIDPLLGGEQVTTSAMFALPRVSGTCGRVNHTEGMIFRRRPAGNAAKRPSALLEPKELAVKTIQ
jgi:hypothetical protein